MEGIQVFRNVALSGKLNDLRTKGYRYFANPSGFLAWNAMGGTGYFFIFYTSESLRSPKPQPGLLPYIPIVCWLACCLAMGFMSVYFTPAYREKLRDKVLNKETALELLAWPNSLPMVHDYVPLPMRFILGFRPKNEDQWLRYVVSHLDWYLGKPDRVIRIEWLLCILAMLELGLVALVITVVRHQFGNEVIQQSWIFKHYYLLVITFFTLAFSGEQLVRCRNEVNLNELLSVIQDN
ncbi:MAG: hypothetical protein H7A35_09195 [Planctomycetales bacterium]|nr:hypothetical protein [bacterium]UNM07054.1 MAG: hypothetical protein H7A35_09195 [Planctomycetales bacterium]